MNILKNTVLILCLSISINSYAAEKDEIQAQEEFKYEEEIEKEVIKTIKEEEKNHRTFEDTIPSYILNNGEDNFFTLTEENDFFGGEGTDRNYTNGVMLTWFNRDIRESSIAEWLSDVIPLFEMDGTTSVYYSIGHNLYTPADIEKEIPDPDDRPYAAFLYGTVGFTDIEGDHIDDIEVTLGVIGPAALGEEIQTNYHSLIDTTDPKGWDYQLKNEPAFMLSWQRRWPEVLATDTWGGGYFRVMPHVGATVGNIYTYANTGFSMQLMPKSDRWQSQPLRVRPAIPGSGFFSNFSNNWSWMLFAGAEGRAVARNIFLDGNSFRDSPSVDKNYFVADINGGLALSYKNLRISYTINWRSEEFKNQDESHIFGAVSISARF